MNKTRKNVVALGLFFVSTLSAAAPAPLSLEGFLSQVKANNPGIQGALQASEAGFARAGESAMLFSPQLLGNAQFAKDQKPSTDPSFSYDDVVNHGYSVGVAWQAPFGLQTKVSYGLNYYNFHNVGMAVGSQNLAYSSLSYFETKPSIELTQPLWSNGFGRSTRATSRVIATQALASAYGNRFQAKVGLVEAETLYWRLSLARQAVTVQKNALDRATKILDWNAKRVQLNLSDEADVLQARALVEVRKLDLEASLNEQREASRALNTARNIDSDIVEDVLTDFTPERANNASAPERTRRRDDLYAAEQAQGLAIASATVAEERNAPTLDLFATYSLNGKKNELTESLSDPFAAQHPTKAVGVKLVLPLNIGAMTDSKRAWIAEQAAAERSYEKKFFDEEASWKSLNEKFNEAKRRFELIKSLEQAQLKKLTHEKSRLQRGRTVTYQVLLFEQDYLLSELSRLRSQAEILTLAAQFKLYSEN